MNLDPLLTIQNDEELVQHLYRIFCEDTRLNGSQAARVEFHTTLHYLEPHLFPGAQVLDIGAGAGEYSLHLSRRGCQVTAVELAQANLEAFREKLRPEDSIDLRQGNALDLSAWANDQFDAVLCLGPLYHLHAPEDRQQAIREALRVCKPGGVALFAFIQNDMCILTEMTYNSHFLTGDSYDHETFRLHDFPFVFATLDDCRAMLRQAGAQLLHEVASDGPAELMANTINALNEAEYRQFLRYHFLTCEKPEMLGFSNHLLFVCKK